MSQAFQQQDTKKSNKPARSYIICANYRSGSTLLTAALKDSKVAGYPTEYFIGPKIEHEKKTLGLGFDYTAEHVTDYIEALVSRYQTSNGIFGFKIMYQEFAQLMKYLRERTDASDPTDAQILEAQFPNLRYIYIYRRQKLLQAISLTKSHLTKVWHRDPNTELPDYSDKVRFDMYRIDRNVENMIIRYEMNWDRFFYENNITPLVIAYEDLVQDYEQSIHRVLNFITGDDGPWEIGEPPLAPTADEVNAEWHRLYHEKRGWIADEWIQRSLETNQYSPALLALLDRERKRLNALVDKEKKKHETEMAELKTKYDASVDLIYQPTLIKDFIPWRILLKAMALKALRFPKRILQNTLNSKTEADTTDTLA